MTAQLFLITLWSEDIHRSIHFYREILRIPLKHVHAGPPHFDLEGPLLVLQKGKPLQNFDSHGERFPQIALKVTDLDERVQQLSSHNVALPWGIEENASMRWVMFFDPDGNLLELVQAK